MYPDALRERVAETGSHLVTSMVYVCTSYPIMLCASSCYFQLKLCEKDSTSPHHPLSLPLINTAVRRNHTEPQTWMQSQTIGRGRPSPRSRDPPLETRHGRSRAPLTSLGLTLKYLMLQQFASLPLVVMDTKPPFPPAGAPSGKRVT